MSKKNYSLEDYVQIYLCAPHLQGHVNKHLNRKPLNINKELYDILNREYEEEQLEFIRKTDSHKLRTIVFNERIKMTANIFNEFLKRSPYILSDIFHNSYMYSKFSQFITNENISDVILREPSIISSLSTKYITNELFTTDLCMKLINKSSYNVVHLPEQFVTKELFKFALDKTPDIIEYDAYAGNGYSVAIAENYRKKFNL